MKVCHMGPVSADVPGKIVQGIFGFCDIRNFTDCTETLREETVKMVNRVAYIVHGAVIDNFGAPNKNIGDAFLVVWKPKGTHSILEVADCALRSYIRTIIEVSQCETLGKLSRRTELQRRMPGFRVRLGFGLHFGWAVEGAIGSPHKIDISYLSPHVNMASRLESATKFYGVSILLSEDVYSLLSLDVQGQCRIVDRAKLKGTDKPVYLYTYDVPVASSSDRHGRESGPLALSADAPKDLESLLETKTQRSMSIGCNPDWAAMGLRDFFAIGVPPATEASFRRRWRQAVELYLGGPGGRGADWLAARAALEQLAGMCPSEHDGPRAALLDVMAGLCQPDGRAPADWPGFHCLAEK